MVIMICVALSKPLHPSVPQFPNLENRKDLCFQAWEDGPR